MLELAVFTDLEVALASLDKIPAAAAAESCMARLGCDWGVPSAGTVPCFQHPANSVPGVGRAARLLAGAWVIPVSM